MYFILFRESENQVVGPRDSIRVTKNPLDEVTTRHWQIDYKLHASTCQPKGELRRGPNQYQRKHENSQRLFTYPI